MPKSCFVFWIFHRKTSPHNPILVIEKLKSGIFSQCTKPICQNHFGFEFFLKHDPFGKIAHTNSKIRVFHSENRPHAKGDEKAQSGHDEKPIAKIFGLKFSQNQRDFCKCPNQVQNSFGLNFLEKHRTLIQYGLTHITAIFIPKTTHLCQLGWQSSRTGIFSTSNTQYAKIFWCFWIFHSKNITTQYGEKLPIIMFFSTNPNPISKSCFVFWIFFEKSTLWQYYYDKVPQ